MCLAIAGSFIDYIAVSGTMESNVLEYVDHMHEPLPVLDQRESMVQRTKQTR